LESFSLLGSCSSRGNVWLVEIVPVTRNLLLIFESDLDSLSSLHADLSEVEVFRAHSQLWNGQVCAEFDCVGRTALDVDRQEVPLFAELGGFSCGIHDTEGSRGVWHELLNFVWLNGDSSLCQELLVEVEGHRESTDVCQTERLSFGGADDHVSEITNIGCDGDALEVNSAMTAASE